MNQAVDNFVAEQDAAWYAGLYKEAGLKGGHIILLNPEQSEYYDADLLQAEAALRKFPGGLMIGGGIHCGNAPHFIACGASHVIVTSYVFKDGQINLDNLKAIEQAVGRDHLVLDLSCRKKDGQYFIVTDRWQKFTDRIVDQETLDYLAPYCSEFLIHAVDVEGKSAGIEKELAVLLGNWHGIPITYAGGVGCMEDVALLKRLGKNHLDVTIGSALDIFGGTIPFEWAAKIS